MKNRICLLLIISLIINPIFTGDQKTSSNDLEILLKNIEENNEKEIAYTIKAIQEHTTNAPLDELLRISSLRNFTEGIKTLFKIVNFSQKGKDKSLRAASSKGYLDLAKILIENGANPANPTGEENNIPLTIAAANGHSDIVDLLLAHAPEAINHQNRDNVTPLAIAAAKGHSGIVQSLLEQGADATLSVSENRIPLFLATANGHSDVIKLLLAYAPETINHQNIYGDTILITAIDKENKNITQFLLDQGADATLKNTIEMSPIIGLALKGEWDILRNLLSSERYKSQAKELFTQHKTQGLSVSDILNYAFKKKSIGKVTLKKFEKITNVSQKPPTKEDEERIEKIIKELLNPSRPKPIMEPKKKKKKKKGKKFTPPKKEKEEETVEEFKELPGPAALSPSEAQHLLKKNKNNLIIHLTKALLQWEDHPIKQLEKDGYFSRKTPRGRLFRKLETKNGAKRTQEIIIHAHSLVPYYIIKYLVAHPLNAQIEDNLVKIYTSLTIKKPDEQLEGTYELFFKNISTDEIIVYHSLFKDHRYQDIFANLPSETLAQDSGNKIETSPQAETEESNYQEDEWEHATQWTIEDAQNEITFTDNTSKTSYTFSKH